MLINDCKTSQIWLSFISHIRSELPFRRKRKPRKLKPLRLKKKTPRDESRRPEKNHFKAWETPNMFTEDDTGNVITTSGRAWAILLDFGDFIIVDIVSWMKSKGFQEKTLSDDGDEALLMRRYGVITCPSIENTGVFERDSLHDRFVQSGQFTGGEKISENAEKTTPEPKTVTPPKTAERPKSESFAKTADVPVKHPEQTVVINVAKRVCKSAVPPRHSPARKSEEKVAVAADDNVSLPDGECVSAGQSQGSSRNAADLPESKTKVRKLIGLAQKYMSKPDMVRDEGEDCNDEGYDSKISSNDADVTEDFKNVEEVLLARERYLAETYDVDQNLHHMNTFQWIRDPAGLSPGRIVKLSYSQREKTFYSLNNDRSDSLARTIGRSNTNTNIRGIMAASLSNLSPSSLNMRHFRDTSNLHILNYGAPGTPRWGYENNSRGQFLPAESVSDNRPASMVLRKVTIQDANDEGSLPGEKTRSSENIPESPESKRTEPTLTREKSKLQISRTSPQLTIDATKINRNGSIPSQQQTRNMASRVMARREDLNTPKSYDPRECIYNDSSSSTRIPIGDLLPAVERSLQKTQSQRGKRSQGDGSYPGGKGHDPSGAYPSLSEEERAILIKRDMDALAASYEPPHGPPAFLPLHTRSPLQRAKEIANKRLHGHVTQNPDGTETVRVSSPRYQPRGFQRRAGSATGRSTASQDTSRSPRQDKTPRLLLSKSKNTQKDSETSQKVPSHFRSALLGKVISGPFRGKCKFVDEGSYQLPFP